MVHDSLWRFMMIRYDVYQIITMPIVTLMMMVMMMRSVVVLAHRYNAIMLYRVPLFGGLPPTLTLFRIFPLKGQHKDYLVGQLTVVVLMVMVIGIKLWQNFNHHCAPNCQGAIGSRRKVSNAMIHYVEDKLSKILQLKIKRNFQLLDCFKLHSLKIQNIHQKGVL